MKDDNLREELITLKSLMILITPAPKIIEVAYKWAQPLKYDLKPSMIVYHHTAEINITPEKID